MEEERDAQGNLKKVLVESVRYVESDTALVNRVLGPRGRRQAEHPGLQRRGAPRLPHPARRSRTRTRRTCSAKRRRAEEFFKEATVWVDGLDRIHKLRGINFCVDLSATPYFLGRVGQDTNRTFPWVVSDFGLTDAIESGLVKIPQLAVRDTTGRGDPGLLQHLALDPAKLTPAERGGKKGSPKPEAILKWANMPIAMLGGLWEELREEWEQHKDDPRPPVFILVCKNTKIAKVVYEWLAENKPPTGIPPCEDRGLPQHATARSTPSAWTPRSSTRPTPARPRATNPRGCGSPWTPSARSKWPEDRQGRPLYPEGFEELAKKLGRPLHPPGRDVRCIVSVGMLTEGWDCNTVTHIVGLRPFMSQLLCEQVVGRGLRRASYEVGDGRQAHRGGGQGLRRAVRGHPVQGNAGRARRRRREAASRARAAGEGARSRSSFPRVEGYRQAIRNRITVDWDSVAPLCARPAEDPARGGGEGRRCRTTRAGHR